MKIFIFIYILIAIFINNIFCVLPEYPENSYAEFITEGKYYESNKFTKDNIIITTGKVEEENGILLDNKNKAIIETRNSEIITLVYVEKNFWNSNLNYLKPDKGNFVKLSIYEGYIEEVNSNKIVLSGEDSFLA